MDCLPSSFLLGTDTFDFSVKLFILSVVEPFHFIICIACYKSYDHRETCTLS